MPHRAISYSIIDSARDCRRNVFAEHCCLWSESLFEGSWKTEMADVAPHLYACDLEGIVAWLTLRDRWGGEAGILIECEESFAATRHMLRRRLNAIRERDRRVVFFRFYDPRVLRVFLPACTPSELHEFFGPMTAIHCQSETNLHVNSYTLDSTNTLQINITHIDDFLVSKGFVSPEDMESARESLPEAQKIQQGT